MGIINGPRPYSYHKHIYFINFEEFGHVNPIWISMIRNPVDKFVSRYYYNKNRRTFHELKRKNSSQVLGLTLSKWKRISADQCINLLMPECHLIPGKPHELTIVSLNSILSIFESNLAPNCSPIFADKRMTALYWGHAGLTTKRFTMWKPGIKFLEYWNFFKAHCKFLKPSYLNSFKM